MKKEKRKKEKKTQTKGMCILINTSPVTLHLDTPKTPNFKNYICRRKTGKIEAFFSLSFHISLCNPPPLFFCEQTKTKQNRGKG